MPRLAVYMRVSTDKQSTDSQEHAIRAWLTSQGIDPDDGTKVCWYIDNMTGATIERKALQLLNQHIELGLVNRVIFWKLDRFSRKMIDGLVLLSEWLNRGVHVTSITQNFDFRGPMGQAVAALMLALAEMERDNIRERIRAGIAKAKAQGKRWGGASKYHKQVNYYTKKRCVQLYVNGYGATAISRMTGVSRTHVYNICKQNKQWAEWHKEAKQRRKETRLPADSHAYSRDNKTLKAVERILTTEQGAPDETDTRTT